MRAESDGAGAVQGGGMGGGECVEVSAGTRDERGEYLQDEVQAEAEAEAEGEAMAADTRKRMSFSKAMTLKTGKRAFRLPPYREPQTLNPKPLRLAKRRYFNVRLCAPVGVGVGVCPCLSVCFRKP